MIQTEQAIQIVGTKMSFVHVELIEDRTEEQLANMVKDIIEVVSKDAGAPKENIHVIINKPKKDRYTQGDERKK